MTFGEKDFRVELSIPVFFLGLHEISNFKKASVVCDITFTKFNIFTHQVGPCSGN